MFSSFKASPTVCLRTHRLSMLSILTYDLKILFCSQMHSSAPLMMSKSAIPLTKGHVTSWQVQRWDDRIILVKYLGMSFSLADVNCYKQVEPLTDMLVTFLGILKAEDIGPRACFRSWGWFWYDFEAHFTNKLRVIWKYIKDGMPRTDDGFSLSFLVFNVLVWASTLPFEREKGENVEGPITCRIIWHHSKRFYFDLYRWYQ